MTDEAGYLKNPKINLICVENGEEILKDRTTLSKKPLSKSLFEKLWRENHEEMNLYSFDCSSILSKKFINSITRISSSGYVNLKRDSPFFNRHFQSKKYIGFLSDEGKGKEFLWDYITHDKMVNMVMFVQFDNDVKLWRTYIPQDADKSVQILRKIGKSDVIKEIRKYVMRSSIDRGNLRITDTIYLSDEKDLPQGAENAKMEDEEEIADIASLMITEAEDSDEMKILLSRKRICWSCRKDSSVVQLSKCLGFRKARYCSEFCQRQDWGKHMGYCRKRQEEKKAKI